VAIEAYSNQVEIPGIASIIHEDVFNQATYGNHCELSTGATPTILAVYNDTTNSKGMLRIGTRVSDFAIEWGTAVEFYNGTVEHIIPVRVSDTKFMIVYSHAGDNDGYCIAGTVSGTVPTLGSEVEFANGTTCINIGAVLMDTDKVMIAYQDGTTNQKAIIASFSGTTISLGSAATINSTIDSSVYTNTTQLCKHSATLATVVYRVSATVTEAVTLSLSGTAINVNTAGKAAFGGSADIRYPSIGALDSTRFVVAYTDATDSNKQNAQVGAISGTTITSGSEYTINTGALAPASIPCLAIISSQYFAVTYSYGNEVFAKICASASTSIGSFTSLTITTTGASYYPGAYANTKVNLTYTKSNQLTFSYLNVNLNQFICGMFEHIGATSARYIPMCYKVAGASTGEQIEISSLYLKNNLYQFSNTNGIYGYVYKNGTLSSNTLYKSANGDYFNPGAYSSAQINTICMPLANSPIILQENESLFATITANQGNSSEKGSCTVFGIKRS
jgi:hypothetical protein